MPPGGPGGFGGVRRTFSRDASVTEQKVAPGTARRIFRYVRPYRKMLTIFLILIVIDAVIGVINPLLFREIINLGIMDHKPSLIIYACARRGRSSLFDAGLGLFETWFSSRIGQGLVFDMRTQVFEHVESMSLAFFTRTQTGALVSRLNNDVNGAQQAFTDIFLQ